MLYLVFDISAEIAQILRLVVRDRKSLSVRVFSLSTTCSFMQNLTKRMVVFIRKRPINTPYVK